METGNLDDSYTDLVIDESHGLSEYSGPIQDRMDVDTSTFVEQTTPVEEEDTQILQQTSPGTSKLTKADEVLPSSLAEDVYLNDRDMNDSNDSLVRSSETNATNINNESESHLSNDTNVVSEHVDIATCLNSDLEDITVPPGSKDLDIGGSPLSPKYIEENEINLNPATMESTENISHKITAGYPVEDSCNNNSNNCLKISDNASEQDSSHQVAAEVDIVDKSYVENSQQLHEVGNATSGSDCSESVDKRSANTLTSENTALDNSDDVILTDGKATEAPTQFIDTANDSNTTYTALSVQYSDPGTTGSETITVGNEDSQLSPCSDDLTIISSYIPIRRAPRAPSASGAHASGPSSTHPSTGAALDPSPGASGSSPVTHPGTRGGLTQGYPVVEIVPDNQPEFTRNFHWNTIDNVSIPCFNRGDIQYVSVKMVEHKLLSKFPKLEDLNFGPIYSYYVNQAEAELLSNISKHFYNSCFKKFTTRDLVVSLDDFVDFYNKTKAFYETAQASKMDNLQVQGGWVQINNTLVPYVMRTGMKMVPLSVVKYGAGLLIDARLSTHKVSVTQAEYEYMNNACQQANINFTFNTQTKLIKLELVIRMSESRVSVKELPPQNPQQCAIFNTPGQNTSAPNPTMQQQNTYCQQYRYPPHMAFQGQTQQQMIPNALHQFTSNLPRNHMAMPQFVNSNMAAGHQMNLGSMNVGSNHQMNISSNMASNIGSNRQTNLSASIASNQINMGANLFATSQTGQIPGRMPPNPQLFSQMQHSRTSGNPPSHPRQLPAGPSGQYQPQASYNSSPPMSAGVVSVHGMRVSCVWRGSEPYTTLDVLQRVFFPQLALDDFKFIVGSRMKVAMAAISPPEEQSLAPVKIPYLILIKEFQQHYEVIKQIVNTYLLMTSRRSSDGDDGPSAKKPKLKRLEDTVAKLKMKKEQGPS